MVSAISAAYYCLNFYFHIRLIVLQDVPFIHELVAYDNPEGETILSGKYRTRVTAFITKVVKILTFAEYAISSCFIFAVFVVVIVTPIMILGFSIENILYWSINSILTFTMGYYTS